MSTWVFICRKEWLKLRWIRRCPSNFNTLWLYSFYILESLRNSHGPVKRGKQGKQGWALHGQRHFLGYWTKTATASCNLYKCVLVNGRKKKFNPKCQPFLCELVRQKENVWGHWSIKLQTKLKVCRRVVGSNHPQAEAARTGSTTVTLKTRTKARHTAGQELPASFSLFFKRLLVPNRSLWNYYLEALTSVKLKFSWKVIKT